MKWFWQKTKEELIKDKFERALDRVWWRMIRGVEV